MVSMTSSDDFSNLLSVFMRGIKSLKARVNVLLRTSHCIEMERYDNSCTYYQGVNCTNELGVSAARPEDPEPKRLKVDGGVIGEGQPALLLPAKDSGIAVSSSSRVRPQKSFLAF